jgi:hypothetical protein
MALFIRKWFVSGEKIATGFNRDENEILDPRDYERFRTVDEIKKNPNERSCS